MSAAVDEEANPPAAPAHLHQLQLEHEPPTATDAAKSASSVAKRVLVSQVQLVSVFIAIVGFTPAILWLNSKSPPQRAFQLFDMSLWNVDHNRMLESVDSPSNGLVIIVSLLYWIITIILVELPTWYGGKRFGLSSVALTARVLHWVSNFFLCFIFSVFLQQASTGLVGIKRPDFMQSCDPFSVLPGGRANATAYLGVDLYPETACAEIVKDEMKSFVSGHASLPLTVTLHAIVVMTHSIFYRGQLSLKQLYFPAAGLAQHILTTLLVYWQLFALGSCLFIAASRVPAHRHHPADVLGGLVIAIVSSTVALLGSILESQFMSLETQQWISDGVERRPKGVDADPGLV